jgi:hypothetical protein
MQASHEPFRGVRAEQLRRLEMCERALADAFRRQARHRRGREAEMLHAFASEGDRLAELLRERLAALGGEPDPAVDESWLVDESLADAEQLAVATYHDHLGDHDPETAALIWQKILPHHRAARAWLERDSPRVRDSEL